MKLQLKIFIIFTAVMVILLSTINYLTIYFLKEQQLIYERELLSAYDEVIKQNNSYQLPAYIIRYGNELSIDKHFSEERFKNFSKTLLIWEGLFIVILSYIFYRLLNVISKKEVEQETFLKFLFFVLSHKIGNFLSMMKLNIELLKHKPEQRIIERLQSSCRVMEEDLNNTLETVKKIQKLSKNKEKINLKESIERVLKSFPIEKKTTINTKDITLSLNKDAYEAILFLLLDNAFRYSHSKVHIRVFEKFIAIRNDFLEIVKGSGLGLQIAEYLCKINNFKLKYRAKNNNFLVIFRFS
jgi:signal transduction histidine kinase